MKKTGLWIGMAAILLWTVACAPTATVMTTGGQSIDQAQAEDYNGPKARMAVGEFTDKTAKGGWSGGWRGMFGMDFKPAELSDSKPRQLLLTANQMDLLFH